MNDLFLSISPIIWLLASGLANALGEYLSKHWADKPSLYLAILVALAYAASTFLWLPALLHTNKLSTMGTLWLLIATVTTLFIGVFIFKEHLSTLQWIGVFLAFLSMIFLNWK